VKILVTGSSGFIGTALCARLDAADHEVVPVARNNGPAIADSLEWDVDAGKIDFRAIQGSDAIIHLAGENIADGRWDDAKKRRLVESRVDATRRLCENLAESPQRPAHFLCGSAIGFYGSRGDELLDEGSEGGSGFFAELCRHWEAACEPLARAGARVVHLRTGVVLGKGGGALKKMLLPFRLGTGGVIGDGEQYMSWIDLDDLVRALELCLENESIKGPVNLVSSNPVTNRVFTKTLGRVLRRPTVLPMPAGLARFLFGEMADETLLASQRVQPTKLSQAGFRFEHPMLEGALRSILER